MYYINAPHFVITVTRPDGTRGPLIPDQAQTAASNAAADRLGRFGWRPWRWEQRTKLES